MVPGYETSLDKKEFCLVWSPESNFPVLTGLSYHSTGEKLCIFVQLESQCHCPHMREMNMNQTSLVYPFPKVCPFCFLFHSTLETSSRQFKGGHRGAVKVNLFPTVAALSSHSSDVHAAAAHALVWFLPSFHPFRSSPPPAPWSLQMPWVPVHSSLWCLSTQKCC